MDISLTELNAFICNNTVDLPGVVNIFRKIIKGYDYHIIVDFCCFDDLDQISKNQKQNSVLKRIEKIAAHIKAKVANFKLTIHTMENALNLGTIFEKSREFEEIYAVHHDLVSESYAKKQSK